MRTDKLYDLLGVLYGLLTALSFSISPILLKKGYLELDSPLVAASIGIVAAALAHGIYLGGTGRYREWPRLNRRAVLFLGLSSLFIALGAITRCLRPIKLCLEILPAHPSIRFILVCLDYGKSFSEKQFIFAGILWPFMTLILKNRR
ncbi:MAG: hypothetical protein ACE5JP_06690 [Candidatus Bipolaricaulia bacterium]